MSDKPIDAEVLPETQAIAVRQQAGGVGRALTIEELHANLEYVRRVMRQEMRDGQDYGTIPGCGPKPTLLQPGAQKLLMTFNLSEQVRREELKDFPGGHREYAFTICVKAPNGKEWDGVGTCSTLEAKYRYRTSGRKCPKCGKENIRKSKQGGGWYCWEKTGGCGANFPADNAYIAGQTEGRVEHDNPADFWNTVRKMAFKRALVAAAINATNTSELWTQDVEDMSENGTAAPAKAPQTGATKPPPSAHTPPVKTPPAPTGSEPIPAQSPAAPIIPFPTAKHRQRMIEALKASPGAPNRDIVTEYFRKVENPAQLMPHEELEDLPLRFVPATKEQMTDLASCITGFGNGGRAAAAFPPHPEPPTTKPPPAPVTAFPKRPTVPKDQAWREVIVTVPRKGMKKAEYEAHPDTIGSLYDLRHGNDEEAESARRRLWWLAKEWKPEPREFKGKVYQPSQADFKAREALDAFLLFFERNHPDEKL